MRRRILGEVMASYWREYGQFEGKTDCSNEGHADMEEAIEAKGVGEPCQELSEKDTPDDKTRASEEKHSKGRHDELELLR